MGQFLKENWLGILIAAVCGAVMEGSLQAYTSYKEDKLIREEVRSYMDEHLELINKEV